MLYLKYVKLSNACMGILGVDNPVEIAKIINGAKVNIIVNNVEARNV